MATNNYGYALFDSENVSKLGKLKIESTDPVVIAGVSNTFKATGLEGMSGSLTDGLNAMSSGLTDLLNSASRVMTSRPSSSGSGGGFSGGGAGGSSGGGSAGFG